MKVIFTTPQNQKNNILYFAFFSVYLLLIRHKKIKYKKFNKLFGTNLIKLNLTVCENSTMIISIPIELVENPDKLNSSVI